MNRIYFSTHFLRKVKKLSTSDQKAVSQRIELFRSDSNNPKLKLHALTGRLRGYFAFSLDYSRRIVFIKPEKDTILFVDVGSHDEVYR